MSEEVSAGALIPQVFYDLLSRIAPGALALPTMAAAVVGPREFGQLVAAWTSSGSAPGLSSWLVLLIALLLSYFTGILLRGLDYLVFHEGIDRFRKGRSGEIVPGVKYDPYYHIKIVNPEAGSRITKMKAERSMAAVHETGFVIAVLADLGFLTMASRDDRLVFGAILLVATLSIDAFRRHLARRVKIVITQHCRILQIPE